MREPEIVRRRVFCLLVAVLCAPTGKAETLHVDARMGRDDAPGTKDRPLRTLERAAALVNAHTASGPATIVVSAGLYSLDRCVLFSSDRTFTEQGRLTIRAAVLPGDPQWRADLMPVIASAENPCQPGAPGSMSETYSLKIQTSHATVQGLRFAGNPLLRNMHCCIERVGDNLDDLVVTQCAFAGSAGSSDIYCATLATGDRFVVDHCTFSGCHACAVFWDGPEGVGGNRCAMRYCIVRDAHISAVWTCRSAEDFEFHHNVVAESEYLWMRNPGDQQTYRITDCVVFDTRHSSGYGTAAGPSGQTGPEVRFERSNVVTEGDIVFASTQPLCLAEASAGFDLGAGLFRNQGGERP